MERDVREKLSQILGITILFSKNIQSLREKLAGHDEFFPEQGFFRIDRDRKGYINQSDLSAFLNHKISEDVLRRFIIQYNPYRQKLSYIEYLRIIKPYFDGRLAQAVLSRRPNKQQAKQNPFSTIMGEIFLLFCIMFAELDELKRELAEKYMLNCGQIRARLMNKIEFLKEQETPRMIFRYIQSGGYKIQQNDIKYLECYLGRKFNLDEDQTIRGLFLPVYDIDHESEKEHKIAKSRPPSKSKPDFLGFKVKNGRDIIQIQDEIVVKQKSINEFEVLFESRVSRQKSHSVPVPMSYPDFNITPIKPVPNSPKYLDMDTPILAGFMKDEPLLLKSFLQMKSEANPEVKLQFKEESRKKKVPQFLIGQNILDNFIMESRVRREEFPDSLIASKNSDPTFRYF